MPEGYMCQDNYIHNMLDNIYDVLVTLVYQAFQVVLLIV